MTYVHSLPVAPHQGARIPTEHASTYPASAYPASGSTAVRAQRSGEEYPPRRTSQQLLGDYPFKQIVMQAFGSDYDRDIVTLVARLNANAGWGCKIIQGTSCYRPDEVEKVVSVYTNLVRKRTIPEYDREGRYSSAITQIEQHVAELSGVNVKRVAAILYQLYYGVRDGSIKLDRLLWPLRAEATDEVRQTDEESINTGSVSNIVKYAVPIAIGVGVLYVLTQITTVSTNIKQMLKG